MVEPFAAAFVLASLVLAPPSSPSTPLAEARIAGSTQCRSIDTRVNDDRSSIPESLLWSSHICWSTGAPNLRVLQ